MSKYNVPMGDPLDMLIEECAEVIKVCTKIKRFGMTSDYILKKTGRDNKSFLVEELGDVLGVIRILCQEHIIEYKECQVASNKKILRIEKLYGNSYNLDEGKL